MTQEQQEIERLRSHLQQQLTRAPAWMSTASVQKVREWKDNFKRAQKLVEKKTATAGQLQSAINSVL